MTTKHRGERVSNLIHLLPGSLLIYFDVNDLQPKGLWSYMYTFPVFWNPEGRKTPFIRKFYYVFSCKQGVIDTVKMGDNHYGFRSRLANFSTSDRFMINLPSGVVASQQFTIIASGWYRLITRSTSEQ